MLSAIEKARKQLSANKEAGVNVECLMEEEDLFHNLARDELEGLIEPYVQKLQQVADRAIKAAGLALDQIHSVEMIGEATRIPIVQEVAKKAF